MLQNKHPGMTENDAIKWSKKLVKWDLYINTM